MEIRSLGIEKLAHFAKKKTRIIFTSHFNVHKSGIAYDFREYVPFFSATKIWFWIWNREFHFISKADDVNVILKSHCSACMMASANTLASLVDIVRPFSSPNCVRKFYFSLCVSVLHDTFWRSVFKYNTTAGSAYTNSWHFRYIFQALAM